MDFLTRREIEEVKGESEIINQSLDVYKDRFATKLQGEYGEKMLQEMNGVFSEEDKKIEKKIKRKLFIKRIKDILFETNDTEN